ncbi:MAG: transcription-repair coupling factor [Corallococcus sp.]|nr:transcription-repair coupling factor [Corallococcus sp.]MCM1359512.1 transcription-repair coupling factor [Corallococcus sp.]MCM1395104.1 transcription-repair coupling factor [Corallococcus sp.]
MSYFFDKVNNAEAYRNLLNDTRNKNFIAAFGVQPAEKPFIAANTQGFCLYVTADYVEAQRVYRTVSALRADTVYLPAVDDVLLFKRSGSKNSVYERNFALYSVLRGASAAVATVDAVIQLFPQRDKFAADVFTLEKGKNYDTANVVSRLIACGYKRVQGISAEGEFVLRGDILDVSMPFGKRFRVDFFDDLVEEIKVVTDADAPSQSADFFTVYPLYETSGMLASDLAQIGKLVAKVKLPNAQTRLQQILSDISLSAADGIADNSWLAPFVPSSRLFDYLPEGATVFWDEPKMLTRRVEFLYNEHNERVANLSRAGEILPAHVAALQPQPDVFSSSFHQAALQTLPYQTQWFAPQQIYNFKTGAVANYAVSNEALALDLKNWKRLGYEVVIFAGSDGVQPVAAQLAEYGVFVKEAPKLEQNLADALILPVGLEKGFVSHTNKLAIIGTRDIGRGLSRQSLRKSKKQAFLSVERGDYVVHDVHGIGLCEGIQKVTSPTGEVKDYIVVLYKHGDRLYVPVDSTNMLSRYSGGENPALSKIGGEDFSKIKSKVKSGIREMSVNLLKLYAEREKSRGFKYHIDAYLEEEFQQYFPYKATDDQIKCQQEITQDLTSDKIMDRVLVGDVGYGKTEVAMRAAFDVVSNGYQVAVLVPTTILAEQHYATFRERMSHFDIKVQCLNRFRSEAEQRAILQSVKDGKVDVVIGTHRLLSKDVGFNKLGLLILDEEQRFGVEHKEKIKSIKTSVDVLTLSATPIPRTLHMALSGIRDISTITTPPVERMAVETFVVEENEALVADVVARELARGGQVYCVYNRVQSIDRFASEIQELVPDAKVGVAHGQMDETVLEDAIMAFSEGKTNVLVCTTIIENGIDIPNANTLIVCDADRLGLAQLYQLRGRVGRSNRLAYAYFMYRRDKILNEDAYKRLSSITEYSELGSGFKIAMKDLEIRGAGNILGREQHGHMMKVGYDMYARLLKETVAELKGQAVEQKINVDLEIDLEAYAPDDYISLQNERMDFYRRLADCETAEEIQSVRSQLADVYGAPPKQVQNLFDVATVKLLAANAGVSKVTVKPGRGEIVFAKRENMMNKQVFDALADSGTSVTAASNGYSLVFQSADYMQKTRLLAAITRFLLKLQKQ